MIVGYADIILSMNFLHPVASDNDMINYTKYVAMTHLETYQLVGYHLQVRYN
jgi:hypothetical protein